VSEFPISSATLTLTHQCNLRCQHCFTGGKGSAEMTFETGKKCIDFLLRSVQEANINILSGRRRWIEVGFWGGEPLLKWPLVKQLVEYGYSNKEYRDITINFGGTTNGTLLTEDKLDFLEDHQISFMVSIDGTPKTHDSYRKTVDGQGSHLLIMKNLEKALRRFPNMRVRMSPRAETIHNFYEDVRYLVGHGMLNLMFSPVYESAWTEENWNVWEDECFKVIDGILMPLHRRGINVTLEHYSSYMSRFGQWGPPNRIGWDAIVFGSKYPCGAGRFYVNFDTDGSIEPCHRFRKFGDNRRWRDREMCIGHVDCGITRPDIRQKFIDWHKCDCVYAEKTPCNGGCYATNYDLTGDNSKPAPGICRYVKMQKKVSDYLALCRQKDMEKIGKAALELVGMGSGKTSMGIKRQEYA
jgi:uncharacterized protein